MAREIQQIKRDLAVLEETVATLAAELYSIYAKYLRLLSESVQKQLILANYQICTQAYPDSFLSLSLNQRQKFQQNLRQLGKQIRPQLLSHLEFSNQSVDSPKINIIDPMLSKLPMDQEPGENQGQQPLSEQRELPSPTPTEQIKAEAKLPDASEEELSKLNESTEEKLKLITNPDDLFQWQKQIERAINKTLESLSREANRYLQQVRILPDKLPAKVLEMAMKTEENGSAISGSPNLLNLLIETDNNEQSQDSTITKITAICLRLSEIEFSDPTLNAERNKIRNLLGKIGKLREQYQKKQRECAVAQAEAAWRSSWFDD